MARVKVRLNMAAIEALPSEDWVREVLREAGASVARTARATAPRRKHGASRGGAASIAAGEPTMGPRGWVVQVSWDKDHWYMKFPDTGSVHNKPALRFLERALKVRQRLRERV
jgi:hypothetical protein